MKPQRYTGTPIRLDLTKEEYWAFTFVLRDYCEAADGRSELETCNYDGSWNKRMIMEALRLLFASDVFTPREFSQELMERTGVNISARQLKRYADGIFVQLKMLEWSEDKEG